MRHFSHASSSDLPRDPQQRSSWETFRTLGQYLWPKNRVDLRFRVVTAMFSLLISKMISVYTPFLYRQAVNTLSQPAALLSIPTFFIIAYGIARVLQQTFGELRDLIFARVAQHAQRNIALQTFQHLHEMPLEFHLSRQTGGLSRVIERGVKGIQFVLNFMLFNILPTIVEILLVTIILSWNFGWKFGLISAITIIIYITYTFSITDWRIQYRKRMNQKDEEANTKAIDSLLNYETVKYFGNEEHEYKRYDEALADYEVEALKSQTSLSILNIGQGSIIGIGLVLMMWLSGAGVAQGMMTVGDFVLINTYIIQLFVPLNLLGFVYREVKQGLDDMEKMFALLRIRPTIVDATDAEPLDSKQEADIVFDQVEFRYHPERPILQGISFSVPAGKTVAIVGPSGAGKSTISRLLFRFYDVKSGSIRISGKDIRQITQQSLRSAIGIVPQDTVLFNDTIEYNILYGSPGISKERMRQAAELASIDSFVKSLPAGYKTKVGERGLKLSGGEKQRVSIARAFLKDPRILVFDEATSALDSHTEKEIQISLKEVAQKRTTLVIAHRLSTIVDADEILVLKEGKIVERGRHTDLIEMNGEYAEMWRRQQEQQEEEMAHGTSSNSDS